MNTRFSPSLNGSLHLGHLWMAWLNFAWAKQSGGRFLLRFDDLAPLYCGEDTSRQPIFAEEGEHLLRASGIVPDAVSFLSAYVGPEIDDAVRVPGFAQRSDSEQPRVGGENRWLRLPTYEDCVDRVCFPELVAARVRADILEEVGMVIRGEELIPEMQLYEYFNALLGSPPRRLLFLPRLRLRQRGILTTVSKTFGNLQLRDLFLQDKPEAWTRRVQQSGLLDPDAPISLDNLNPDPIIEIE